MGVEYLLAINVVRGARQEHKFSPVGDRHMPCITFVRINPCHRIASSQNDKCTPEMSAKT